MISEHIPCILPIHHPSNDIPTHPKLVLPIQIMDGMVYTKLGQECCRHCTI